MRLKSFSLAVVVISLLFGNSMAFAEGKVGAPQPAASQSIVKKTTAQVKLVNINAASKAELKTLPGISDVEAAKIIAGRPYGSKAQLVTNNIIDRAVYDQLRNRVIAKQTNETIAKIIGSKNNGEN
jgi:DNA uptake protein ComE-like DNA-binding protein